MHAVLAERVEIVVRVRRLQRRADGRKARIADGRRRQALVHTQVVGRILIEVRLRERAGIVLAVRVAETVDDRRVDLELMVGLADVVEAVVDHGGDVRAVLAIRLLFNERGNNEDLLKRIAGLLHLRHQLIVHALREVVEQAADGVRRVLVDEELIGVREKIALEPGDAGLAGVEEAVVEAPALRRAEQRILAVDAVLGQQRNDLPHAVALRDRDGDGIGVDGRVAVAHALNERVVVHVGVELIGADADLVARVAHRAEELEEPLVFDQPLVFELCRNGVDVVVLRDLDGRGERLLIERTHIVRQQPANARQDRRYGDHKDQPKQKAALAALAAIPPAALLARGALRGMGRTLAALAADLPGVPSRGVVFFLMIHKRTALLFKNPKSFFSGQAPICIFPHRIRQSMTSEVKRKCATTMTAPACG